MNKSKIRLTFNEEKLNKIILKSYNVTQVAMCANGMNNLIYYGW